MSFTHSRRPTLMLAVLACLLLALNGATRISTAADNVLHVKPGGMDSGGCNNWADACTLQYALRDVATSGDEIWVAEGVHKPGVSHTDTFQLVSGVELYGGFEGTESSRDARDWQANITVLSGDTDDNDVSDPNGVITTTAHITGTNSYHVVIGSGTDETAILDGFTITGGNADTYPDNDGGGMYNEDGSPTLNNVTFSGNYAAHGGGMSNYNHSSPTLNNVIFSGNSASWGGGMNNLWSSSPTLVNVAFSGNSADSGGGGMRNQSDSSPILTNVIFSGNSASFGGGIRNQSDSRSILTNVIFTGNSADTNGGGMANYESSAALVNVTFSGNSADNAGGLHNSNGSSAALTDCILWSNTATFAPQIDNDVTSTATVNYSLVEGGCPIGVACDHILDADPRLVDPDGPDDIPGTLDDNLRLQLTSPAIDAGDNGAVPSGILTDLDGRPRIVGGTVDMGAYEHQLFYVKPGASGDCSDWGSACDLQTALDTAWEEAGDEIWVAEGTHKPMEGTDQTATFQLVSGVAMYGGFAGTETSRDQRDWQAKVTVLSGDIDSNDITDPNGVLTNTVHISGTNSYHVVTGSGTDETAILDGFAITGGNAYVSGADKYGGGMHNDEGSPTVLNVIFSGNAAAYGGGMANLSGSPTLANVVFSGNSATSDGGGMFNGWQSDSTLTNASFSGNSANDRGGGIFNDDSSPTLANCILWGDTASSGVEIYDYGTSSPTVNYSLVGGGYPGVGNIGSKPQFMDAANGDLRLQRDSPAIDAGSNDALPADSFDLDSDGDTAEKLPLDLDGYFRRVDIPDVTDTGVGPAPIVDMGAYEFQNSIYLPLVLKNHAP